jgi:hypothetical protein
MFQLVRLTEAERIGITRLTGRSPGLAVAIAASIAVSDFAGYSHLAASPR